MSGLKQGVYIRVDGRLERVSEFKHSTDMEWTKAPSNFAPEGNVFVVKCKTCAGSSFTEDGRFTNELSCSSCIGSYTEVYFHKEIE